MIRRATLPILALARLTALNFLNYIDRYILPAVQPLIKDEFRVSDTALGALTTVFFVFYMCSAPGVGFLADRKSRKAIIIIGAFVWSAATLLTAFTYSFTALVIRHTIVGVGEATFALVAPAYLADLFPEERRGRVLSFFYLAIPVGAALGYIIGGALGTRYGWRVPFYVCAVPGFLVATAFYFSGAEPARGAREVALYGIERTTVAGLLRNPRLRTATLGMALMTFAIGGISNWMPTFLERERGNTARARELHLRTHHGGEWPCWYRRRRLAGRPLAAPLARRILPAVGLQCAVGNSGRAICVLRRSGMDISRARNCGVFPLSQHRSVECGHRQFGVPAPIRATAIGLNLFIIHLLGDAISPTIIGAISDRSSLRLGFSVTLIAMLLSGCVLLLGTRFAPGRARDYEPLGT